MLFGCPGGKSLEEATLQEGSCICARAYCPGGVTAKETAANTVEDAALKTATETASSVEEAEQNTAKTTAAKTKEEASQNNGKDFSRESCE